MDRLNESSKNEIKRKLTLINDKSDKKLYAIQVERLTVSFSENANKNVILNRLTLNVPLGCIYGLLGASGSGKTTLIRSILGLIKTTRSGEIRLFHRRIDSKNKYKLQIPGKDVGYMPQDFSLYNDLTVIEQLSYNQIIHNVVICKFACYKLIDLLELGDQINQLVSTLSGGQARRLSFACAMIHKPSLLILDEPTVGVDPLLRSRIWKILTDYVNDCKASVLITTHYIEESRRANMIGFMRRGVLLAEGNPEQLISLYDAKNLEHVFLKLCFKQKRNSKLWKEEDAANHRKQLEDLQFTEKANNLIERSAVNEMLKEEATRRAIEVNRTSIKLKKFLNSEKKIKIDILLKRRRSMFLTQIYHWFFQLAVVVRRIFLQTKRQKSALFAQFLLPLISITLFYFCVGETPKSIQIAIVNEEESPNLSASFLSKLNSEIIKQVNYTNFRLALESVRSGENWGLIRIPRNFTNALIERAQHQAENLNEDLKNETLIQSTIIINADLTNKILVVTITRSLMLSLAKFLNTTLVDLGYRSSLLSFPIRVEEIIYGSFYSIDNDSYHALKDYGTSGLLIILNYSMSFGLTVLVIANENRREMFERNIVIGISPTVLILAHLILRIAFCNLNVALLLYLAKQLFYAPITIPFLYPFALLMLQSLTALSHGMMISALCRDFYMCSVLSNGILLMIFILSGLLWSTESLPTYLRFISSIQPTTIPSESLRWMLSRGYYDITDSKIYNGFLISGIYFFFFILLAVILFEKKH